MESKWDLNDKFLYFIKTLIVSLKIISGSLICI